jgi:hypothetical protein
VKNANKAAETTSGFCQALYDLEMDRDSDKMTWGGFK